MGISVQLQLVEQKSIEPTRTRRDWQKDPVVNKYLKFEDGVSLKDGANQLINFQKYYEIYDHERHVGDIKVFYENEEDIFEQRAQLLMIVGERNRGIGKAALKLLLEKLQAAYRSVYCIIHRSNIASLKMLKSNGFQIEDLNEDNLRLSRKLEEN